MNMNRYGLILSFLFICACAIGHADEPSEKNNNPKASTVEIAPQSQPFWIAPRVNFCKTSCLLLTKYDYSYVQKNICALCGKTDATYCQLDWPSSDVPSCSNYDYMRNCIYAYYGYPFKTKKWQLAFGRTSWYKRDPTFSSSRMSKAAKRNVALLKKWAKEEKHCVR